MTGVAVGPRRAVRAAAVMLAATFAAVAVAAPAQAGPLPISQCTTTSGVILVVDFGHFGGPRLRACGSTPTTGYQLLNQGGWKTEGTGHDGPAFICRIGYSGHQSGKKFPTPQQDPCARTPPATAYWSYWHADPGRNSWSYSQLGAMSYKPKPGSVDAWVFGATDTGGTSGGPRFSPDSVRARNTTPGGGSSPRPSPKPSKPAATKPGAAPTTAAARPGTSTSASLAPPPSAPPSSSVSAEPTPTASESSFLDAAPVEAARTDTGSSAPALVTVGLVLLIGAAGAVVAKRRRAGG
ncbi:LPXTG cell wall anchor domain-containing protein [Catellatospora methionotrophica]|nr:LPXTG cell wall anchor domain-containing protein [Catellatospora methionotrophica]